MLLKPTSSQDQDSTKSETIASGSSGSREGPVSQVKPLLNLTKRSDAVSAKQDSVDDSTVSKSSSQILSPTTTSPKPTQCSGNASSSSHRELEEVEYSEFDANPNVKEGECDMDQQGRDIGSDGSELTDDSDLYSDDDQDDSYSVRALMKV